MDKLETTGRWEGQRGFTLVELLVAIAIVALIAAGIVSVYQASIAQVSHATSLEDAQSGARVVIDQMTRELRVAGSYYNGLDGAGNTITTATPTTITFLGDVDADSVSAGVEATLTAAAASGATSVTVTDAAGFNGYATFAANDWVYIASGSVREVRQIAAGGVAGTTLTLSAGLTNAYAAGSIVRSVERVNYTYAAGTLTRQLGGNPADTVLTGITNFAITYADAAGAALAATPPDPTLIRQVQVSITAQSSTGTDRRTLESRVRFRN